MILVNMIIAIIDEAYHEEVEKLESQNNEYEVLDYIMETMKG